MWYRVHARMRLQRRLLSVHGLQYFRKVCSKSALYSIGVSPEDVPTVDSALAGTRDIRVPGPVPLMDSDYRPPALMPSSEDQPAHDPVVAHALSTRTLQVKDHTLFRVVHKNPNSRKLVRPSTSNLNSEDISVSVHEVRAVWDTAGDVRMCVALQGVRETQPDENFESTRLLSRRHLESVPDLSTCMLEWTPDGGILYLPKTHWPPGITLEHNGRAAVVLTDLVNCGGLPGADVSFLVDQDSEHALVDYFILGELQRDGLVASDAVHLAPEFGGDVLGWQLTEYGLDSVAAFDVVRQPRPALRIREGIKTKDLSAYELVLKMSQDGWSAKPLPTDKKMLPPPYDPSAEDADKVWYYSRTRKTIVATYLQSLLSGTATVHHTGSQQQYKEALCDEDGFVLQISDDVGTAARTYGRKKRTMHA